MITQVRLKNCQSWDDIIINFSTDKLNVIVAENDTGKSVFFKLLKIVASPKYYNREDRKQLIRWGSEYAMIAFAFDSGNLAVVTIRPEYVVYEYIQGEGERIPVYVPPAELLEEVGLLVSNDGEFVVNIIDADQDLLLVNSNLAGNFELIKLLVMNEDMDKLQERTKDLIKEFGDYYIRTSDKKNTIQQQLDGMEHYDVDRLKRDLELCEQIYGSLRKLKDIYDQAVRIDTAEWKDFGKLNCLLSGLERLRELQNASSAISAMKEPVSVIFVDTLQRFTEIVKRLQRVQVNEFSVSPLFVEVLDKLMLISHTIKKISVKKQSFVAISNAVSALEKFNVVANKPRVIRESMQVAKEALVEISELQEELESYGTVLDCPVYGKVVYDGKQCVASNQ